MRNGMWSRRLRVVAVLGSLALLGVSGTSFADDNGRVPVDIANRDRIFQQILDLSIPGVESIAVGLDPVGLKIGVTIFAPKGLPAVAIGRLKFGANVTVDVVQAEGPSPHEDIAGGEVLLPEGPDGPDGEAPSCTAGFAVGVKGGVSGFLTAGHCFDMNKPAAGQEAFVGDFDPVSIIGHERVYEPSDWGIYLFSKSPDEDEALPEIVTDKTTLSIKGIVQPRMGLPVCKHGITTETTCGTVTKLDVRVIYPEAKDSSGNVIRPKVELTGLVQSDACNEGGDSGGPVYTTTADGKTMAVGIISGGVKARGTRRCLETIGKTNVTYVVPLSATPAKGTDTSADVFLKLAP